MGEECLMSDHAEMMILVPPNFGSSQLVDFIKA